MSMGTSSNKKSNVYNEANEALYDPYSDFTFNENFTHIPWPEWNDADLNSEAWDDTKAKWSSAGPKALGHHHTLFEDSNPPILPLGINEYVSVWKRPSEVFPPESLTVYNESNKIFDLTTPSPVADCNFTRTFNEFLTTLQQYAIKVGFSVELESPTFVPTTQGEIWRPWHHIYALCKAGKGQSHKPQYSPYGKYVVRLFYFGTWRKFVVDDKIPCDKYGLCMLPITNLKGELWPIILAKGLLKIISLTSSLIDFPLLSFLTGWIDINLTTANKSHEQIWRRIQVLTPQYKFFDDENKEPKELTTASKKSSTKKETRKMPNLSNGFCVLWANLGGFTLEEVSLKDMKIIITMHRNMPLMKSDKREPTKAWKRLRWVFWAAKKGIWTDELLMPPYRRLEYITFSNKIANVLAPDPIQEATLYAVSELESEEEENEKLFHSEKAMKADQWSDFYRVCEYLINMNVLLKPSSLNVNAKITSIIEIHGKKDLSSGQGPKAATKMPNFFFYSPDLTPTLNQPVLLYCESPTGIFIAFSLWVCPLKKKKPMMGYLDSTQPELLKVGHASLVIEDYDWRALQQGSILGYTKTVANSAIYLNLKPGRRTLRLWINADSSYSLNIYSNVDICLHKGYKIRYLMRFESESILNYIFNVSNAFTSLTLKFGKPELPEALRGFYQTIQPGNDSALDYYFNQDLFIEIFLDSIMLLVKGLVSNTDDLKVMFGAVKSLFFNPHIHCDLPLLHSPSLFISSGKKVAKKSSFSPGTEKSRSQLLRHNWTPEEIEKIIRIQKVFRGYRVRLLWKYQTPARKEFKIYTEKLKKICDMIFSPSKRDFEVGKIIRMIIMKNFKLLTSFKFYEDLPKVVDVDEFTGKIVGVEPFAWVPIARFIIVNHDPKPAPCAFYLSCNLEQFVIMCVNNDTNKEMFAIANTVSPQYYYKNTNGYTIFVFGWNEANLKTINWRLEMMRPKHFQEIHLCNTMLDAPCSPYNLPTIEVCELRNTYVPNSKSRICKCLIKLQKKSLLTLRFTTSYPEAEFLLIITLDSRHLYAETESFSQNNVIAKRFSTNGAILLSSIVLDVAEYNVWWNEDGTVYVLEVFVINNSWPLTKQEWGVVEPIRVNGEFVKELTRNTQLKKSLSDSRRKFIRVSKKSISEKAVESPYWLLQYLNDSSDGDPSEAMVIEEDKSFQESLRIMKLSWEERSFGRKKQGHDLRLKFLYEMYQEFISRQNGGEGYGENKEEENRFTREQTDGFQNLLSKISSFSYLRNNKSPVRYLKSPRVLVWMPTEELLLKYRRDDESEFLSADSSEFVALEVPVRSVTKEEEENRREFLTSCNHFRQVMVKHFIEEQNLSMKLIEQALQKRASAIKRMTKVH